MQIYLLIYLSVVLGLISVVANAETTLTIENWSDGGKEIWDSKIIPAFEAKHPDINIEYTPTEAIKYDEELQARLDNGTAGDLIFCRPYDIPRSIYEKGQLANISKLAGLKNFSDKAKDAWTTADGDSNFCVPVASVIHGFIYNKAAFNSLGLEIPTTNEEFFDVLDKIKADGKYVPLALGTAEQWEASEMGYNNIGVSYWQGDKGRSSLIWGKLKFTDPEFLIPFQNLKRWANYLGEGFQTRTYGDSRNLFTSGQAAIYPAGSWEITLFNEQAKFEMGAFPPPVPKSGDDCYISDHMDLGIGLNAASPNAEAGLVFLEWVASEEFATLYSNVMPGFLSLSNFPLEINDPLVNEFASWRQKCQGSVRLMTRLIDNNALQSGNKLFESSAKVINGTLAPEEAAKIMQIELFGP